MSPLRYALIYTVKMKSMACDYDAFSTSKPVMMVRAKHWRVLEGRGQDQSSWVGGGSENKAGVEGGKCVCGRWV